MADRKVYVNVTHRLIIRMDDGVEVDDVLNEMECSFSDTTGKADVEDTKMLDFEVTDSK
jgi:hypothetical protein